MTKIVYNEIMTKKEKLKQAKLKHYRWIRSLGVNIDLDTGKVNNYFEGFDMPDLSSRPSLPTSDRIIGDTKKRLYSTQLPIGKTISVAYNKGPYMVVDQKDFNTMGKKI
jgi:hypothetical protein